MVVGMTRDEDPKLAVCRDPPLVVSAGHTGIHEGRAMAGGCVFGTK